MQIIVRDNNVEQALRALKKKLQREGVYREMKLRRHYEKPSEKRARERAAAIRRARKLERTRVDRAGTARERRCTGGRPPSPHTPRRAPRASGAKAPPARAAVPAASNGKPLCPSPHLPNRRPAAA